MYKKLQNAYNIEKHLKYSMIHMIFLITLNNIILQENKENNFLINHFYKIY